MKAQVLRFVSELPCGGARLALWLQSIAANSLTQQLPVASSLGALALVGYRPGPALGFRLLPSDLPPRYSTA